MGDSTAGPAAALGEFLPSAEQFAQVMPPGPYLVQHVKDGPWMPARLILAADGWHVEIDGRHLQAHPDPIHAERAMWLFRRGKPCSEADFAYAAAKVAFARAYDPDSPYAHPDRPYHPGVGRPVF